MSQHDMVVADQAGAAFLADVNAAIAALVSNSSGAASPGTTYAFQLWADTTADRLKIRNAANSAWVSWLVLSTGAPVAGVAAGAIISSGLTQATNRLLGRGTAGTGAVEEVSLASTLELLAGVLGVKDGSLSAAKLSGAQTGSAPAIACRATALVDGTLTGTNAPTWGVNITNVQRTATGTYLVTFATAMPHANYGVVFGGLNTSGTNVNYLVLKNGGVKTTTQFEFVCVAGDRTALQDNINMSFAVFA